MTSMRQAINDKCKDCIYDPLSGGGTWRQQVGACTIRNCSLWPIRPKAAASGAKSAQSQPKLSEVTQ